MPSEYKTAVAMTSIFGKRALNQPLSDVRDVVGSAHEYDGIWQVLVRSFDRAATSYQLWRSVQVSQGSRASYLKLSEFVET